MWVIPKIFKTSRSSWIKAFISILDQQCRALFYRYTYILLGNCFQHSARTGSDFKILRSLTKLARTVKNSCKKHIVLNSTVSRSCSKHTSQHSSSIRKHNKWRHYTSQKCTCIWNTIAISPVRFRAMVGAGPSRSLICSNVQHFSFADFAFRECLKI